MSSPGPFKVFLSKLALDDLRAIRDFIAQSDYDAAIATIGDLRRLADSLCSMPHRGRTVPELRELSITSYRELVHSPWRIVYKIHEDTVYVIAILDARRDFIDALHDRLLR